MKICKDLITNDVPAVGQLKGSDCISFETTENADIKLLFLGNSITRHGKAENLGWGGDWGMAASSKENDYVHKLISKFCQKGIKVSVCIANLSDWERTRNMDLLFTKYLSALRFNADYVIVRLGENACPDKYLSEFERIRTMLRRIDGFIFEERSENRSDRFVLGIRAIRQLRGGVGKSKRICFCRNSRPRKRR